MNLNPLVSIATLVGALSGHPLLFAALFLLLFGGLVVLLAGRQAPTFLVGLLRAIASCFYSPILWLRKAMLSTAEFASRAEDADTRGDQYLLNRILTIVSAALIVVAVGGLAAGLASSGAAFIPSKQVRQRLSALGDTLKNQQAELRQAERAQEEIEKRWDTVRAQKVSAYRDAAQVRLSDATRALEQHAQALKDERWFGDFRDELAAVKPADGPARFVQARAAAQRRLEGFYFWDRSIRQHARDYISSWHDAATAEYELRVVPEEDIRQALLDPLVERSNQARERAAETRVELKAVRALAAAGMIRAGLGAVGSVLTFLGTLWLFGLLVEWVWLFIKLADNVGALREKGL